MIKINLNGIDNKKKITHFYKILDQIDWGVRIQISNNNINWIQIKTMSVIQWIIKKLNKFQYNQANLKVRSRLDQVNDLL